MDNKRPDLSQLIPPLPTNTQGVSRLLSAYRSGTSEIQNLLSQECNVILECKICQNMFRSLPNFISHKRAYCLRPAPPLEKILHNNQLPEYYSSVQAIENELGRRDIDQIASRLSKRATIAGSEGIRGENPEATQNVAYFTAIADTIKNRRSTRIEQSTVLAPIPGTSKAVSQTIKQVDVPEEVEKSSEYEPPNKKSKSKRLDEKNGHKNGKSTVGSPKGEKKKDGTYTVMQYPCPICKKVFSKPNGTYRHIRDIHKKNNDQLERMKNSIRKKAFLVTVAKKSQSPPASATVNNNNNNNAAPKVHTPQMVQEPTRLSKAQKEEEKEWNDHTFTVDVGDHRCGYCGVKYERRAALLAHAKQCNKKSKDSSKKQETKTLLKNKGAANRKMSAPMKIVRKYMKQDDDRGRMMANGVKSPLKNPRRNTRSSGVADFKGNLEDVEKRKSSNLFPTIPLTRLRIASGERVVVKNKPESLKPAIPVVPLQSPIVLEEMIKSQKSNASNILVRQVSDKSSLSPAKTSSTSPAKEPPAVASITPMLSVKPKDGFPLNYFSPGSAETKLIGANSVPSSIQIRRDYIKGAQSCDDSVDGSTISDVSADNKPEEPEDVRSASPVIVAQEVSRSKPILNLDNSFNEKPSSAKKMPSEKHKELIEAVKNLDKEEAEVKIIKTPDVEIPLPSPVDCKASSEAPAQVSSEAKSSSVLAQRLKNSTIVAVPVASWDKIPNIASAIKLKLPPDLLLGAKVVLSGDASRKTSPATDASNQESQSASKSAANVPEVSSAARNLITNKFAELGIKIVPKANQAVPSKSDISAAGVKSEPDGKSLRLGRDISHKEEDGFKGWSKESAAKTLAWHPKGIFLNYYRCFGEFVRRKDNEVEIVIEADQSDESVKLLFPPNVKIEYLDK